jgi:hypothetical protein
MFFQNQSALELFALAFPYHYKIYLQLSGAGKRVICIKEGKKKKVAEKIRFNKRISNMSHVHPIQEKKITIQSYYLHL